jgi:hypothetical protein
LIKPKIAATIIRLRDNQKSAIRNQQFKRPSTVILEGSTSMLIRPLSSFATLRNRVKGADYFRSGAVVEIAGGEWSAHAVVRGTRDYRVDLRRESGTDRFTASCECPYYIDRADICKHIWAALLEADRRGLLNGDGAILPTATLEPEYRPTPDLSAAARGSDTTTTAKTPVWAQFLNELHQDATAAERAHPAPRF